VDLGEAARKKSMTDAIRADLDDLISMIDDVIGFSEFTVKERSADGLIIRTSGRWYRIKIEPRATLRKQN
jgi:hypothetical protein